MTKELVTAEERKTFVDKFDNFLFDCDGVLWEGTKLIPGVEKAMEELRSKGKNIYFVTNNSTKSRSSFLKKLQGFGIKASLTEIFSSAFATAAYLKQVLHFPADKKVYIIGMEGIRDELNSEGIRTCGGEVGAVVIGLDLHVNYTKYAKAFTYLKRNPGCHFILTNGDTTFPTHGSIVPGAGSIAAPITKALNRGPDAVLGKPAQNMMEAIFAEYDLKPCKTVMIGDRLDTDIDFGNQGGIETLCVLTGITSKEEMLSPSNKIKPTYYIPSFADLASQ
ncbi:HAD-like domain-containing protein [Zychaea mexicana]|uniref:HAD-like domain-containing protein n=1 Tax=Zychaea mexicana TaxID=64656 RepID=UPI0022FE8860|nr:HAD-like domain-containing protein [Zychaea mexicana]KAI9484716.1 HAD-like domain-containing protein [Zychaea mexicana]